MKKKKEVVSASPLINQLKWKPKLPEFKSNRNYFFGSYIKKGDLKGLGVIVAKASFNGKKFVLIERPEVIVPKKPEKKKEAVKKVVKKKPIKKKVVRKKRTTKKGKKR